MKTLTLNLSEVNDSLDNGEWPDELMEHIEKAIMEAQNEPGATQPNEIILRLVNDFEPEEEESEDESSDDTTEAKE